MKINVYGVGNALVDLQVQVSDEILARTGFEKGIMTLVDDDQQRELLDQISQLPRNQCAGGSAANTIVGIADLGGSVAYCGKVSQDAMGEFFLADMNALGVNVDVTAAAEGPTGTCVVLITPDAQRTMLTNLGVSATLTPEDIDEQQLASPSRIACADALRNLGHSIVGHAVDDDLLDEIAAFVRQRTELIDAAPSRSRPTHDLKRRMYEDAPPDGEGMMHYPDCVVSGPANPMGINIVTYALTH